MSSRSAILTGAVCALGVLASACGSLSSTNDTGTTSALATPAARVVQSLPATVISSDGREVIVTDASRIVSLWGNITEVVLALGLGDRLVGRDIASTQPEIKQVPVVTNAHDVAAEAVLSLRPTLVLAAEDTGPATAIDQIRNVGVPIVRLGSPTSVQDIGPRIRAIAATLGVKDEGERLVTRVEQQLAAVRASAPTGQRPPKVAFLYMRGQAGVYLIGGPQSGADSMIAAAGGSDAGTAMGLTRSFTPITSEALVAAAPEVILMTTTGLASVGGIDGLVQIPGIAQTPAGKDRRIVTLEDGVLFSFGPRTPLALCQLLAGFYNTAPSGGCAALPR